VPAQQFKNIISATVFDSEKHRTHLHIRHTDRLRVCGLSSSGGLGSTNLCRRWR